MIRKFGKYFRKAASLFLWLAVVVIMAHTVIPHDHHTESSCAIPDASCNAQENGNSHHNPLPVHCHAFNDLVCEKFSFSFFKLHHSAYSYLSISVQIVSANVARTGMIVRFYDIQFPLASSGLTASDPFRAPPFFI
jgi:hypothetical protein